MSYDRKYYEKYYQENRKKIAEKRRRKYRVDKKYRETMKERSRAMTQRRQKIGKLLPMFDPNSQPFDGRRMRLIPVNEMSIRVHLTKTLADALGVTTMTVTLWNRDGVIPPPSFVSSDRRRWYSKEYIEMMRMCMMIHYREVRRLDDFKKLTWTAYREIRVSEKKIQGAAA